MLGVFSVVGVLGFNEVGVDSGGNNGWNSDEERDLLPGGSGTFSMVLDGVEVFSELSSLGWVGLVGNLV